MTQNVSSAVLGYQGTNPLQTPDVFPIGVLYGEGIGREIIDVTLAVLDAIAAQGQVRFDLRFGGKIGKDAVQESGMTLTPAVVDFCTQTFAEGGAVLCGPGGARFVYELRRRFDLFCKLAPIQPLPALRDVGVLRPEAVTDVDILVVRENVGGLYFARTEMVTTADGLTATMASEYRESDVMRIIQTAANAAMLRRRRLSVIIKPGAIGAVSELWEACARKICAGIDIELNLLEVDNAAYQLVADAQRFDVVVAPNMFGDVLADGAAVLLGSRGLSYSANFGAGRRAVYQTGHGAAHDLAGKNKANPLGQILSAAMMLQESFGLTTEANALRNAIEHVLAAGGRTRDILPVNDKRMQPIGTREMGERIVEVLLRPAPSCLSPTLNTI